MSRPSTIVMWTAVVLLIGVFLFPLWTIRLHAPQYPQGLGIDIWIDRIEGTAAHDLQNINGLNHYIGMKVISPDAIPELRFMKWALAALTACAALVAMLRRRGLFAAWVVAAVVLSTAGMYDFYRWEYDYGHDLNPEAAIKIPGMSYQPPMFGTKQLLNFTTTAWPGVGGACAILAVSLAALALIVELARRQRRPLAHSEARLRTALVVVLSAAALLVTSCVRGPQRISYGFDSCSYCLMAISDDHYGAELVTDKGRAVKYDSVECMLNALLESKGVDAEHVAGYYTTDFANRGTLIDATTAVYLRSSSLPSPMGMGLASFARRPDAEGVRATHEGDILDWDGARKLVLAHGQGHGQETF